jgi:hypothetical protein
MGDRKKWHTVQLLTVAGDADHGLDMEHEVHQKRLRHLQ